MNTTAACLVALLSTTLLSGPGPGPIADRKADTRPDGPELARHFREAGVTGSIVIVEPRRGVRHEVAAQLNEQAYLPASTFKILNSLVALELGLVRDVDEVLPWDHVDRGSAGWNRDLDMRTALEVSAVWFYQELARRAGLPRMEEFVRKAEYGNRRASPGVDDFWLRGDLRITPNQQVEFLERLHDGKLPFSPRTIARVKEILERDRGEGFVLRAKSGWAVAPEPDVGWWVGWLEHGDDHWYFALRIDITRDEQAPLRERLVRLCLADLGLLPAPSR